MAKTPRVLVVDDDRVTRALLEEILAKEGYATDSADSGEAAVEKVRTSKDYDLVISDIRMGGKSGLDLLREIRAMGAETEKFATNPSFCEPRYFVAEISR